MNFLKFLDAHSSAITALASVLLTIFTFVYVLLTRKLVRQNIDLRKESAKPILSIRAVLDDNPFQIFKLRIENVGGGRAHDIRIRVTNLPLAKGVEHLEKNGVFA
jgi:hypothetical protein